MSFSHDPDQAPEADADERTTADYLVFLRDGMTWTQIAAYEESDDHFNGAHRCAKQAAKHYSGEFLVVKMSGAYPDCQIFHTEVHVASGFIDPQE